MTIARPSASVTTFRPTITDRDICPQCRRQQCVSVCPTSCYARRDDGRVDLDVTRCVECRACVLICYEFTNIEWRAMVSSTGS